MMAFEENFSSFPLQLPSTEILIACARNILQILQKMVRILTSMEISIILTLSAVLDLEFQVIRVIINEAALHSDIWTRLNVSYEGSEADLLPATRIKMLWDSMDACKTFIHTFLSFSSQDLYYLTALIYPRLCYVFITLAKLVFLNSETYNPEQSGESNLQVYQSSPWDTIRAAEAADFHSLASQVLEKFTAAAAMFSGSDGQRNPMSNLASAIKVLMARYEQQIGEVQGAWRTAQSSVLAMETAQNLSSEATDLDTHFQAQAMDNNVHGVFDAQFGWDFLSSVNWDDMLATFT